MLQRRKTEQRLMPSSQESITVTSHELALELKRSYSDFSWQSVPQLIVHGVKYLALYTNHTGEEKKQILVSVLVDLCPDDNVDKLIPPVVDVIWELVKAAIASNCCELCPKVCTVS